MEQGLQSIKREANLAAWAEQIRACRSSGLKVNEWCAANGIRPNAYYRHQKKVFDQYDEEWRIILNCAMKGPVMREWIPSGVILGLNMDEAERNLTIAAAKEAGVTNIYQSFIDDKGLLNAFTL